MTPATRTDVSKTIVLSIRISLMMWSCLVIPPKVGAMLVAENVLVGRQVGPMPKLTEEKSDRLHDTPKWEKRLFDVPLLQQMPPTYDLQWKDGPNFSLKDPGRLPGIELGVEMHSFQALETVVPEGSLPKEIHVNRDRRLLLPPSLNGPDYNGGFLRFTW